MQIDDEPQVRVLDEMDGVFVVTTDDGVEYCLDMNNRQVTRTVEVRTGVRTVLDPESAALVAVATCRVGVPMVLLIDRDVPGVLFTRRTSATVLSINQVSRTPLPQ
ncbi:MULTISPECIES: hypothetical protein [unclassified Microbacterium]|uniref:hypothetical protein n=1 Tax=Microbacterium TaxID=33882 RepID=UPI000D0196B9|nr:MULTISPECIES: hypothetical protein [unclassified Microbacterium]AVL97599.1 hypothetical protein C6C15_11075 [Microbacterium sp. str. 'China']MDH5134712.1 hypothetical protein [Microbacterium sp. RD10]MDH5138270.1 hypothetical protein [Microbacterium sp. RD11]MDH5146557.1 hypothetical protein [Microbacterium sp. RD12]MDH5156241.1 hypothetical protein [Microbacterium sp. RD06]